MSSDFRTKCLERDGFQCRNCGAQATNAHHIVPVAAGGLDVLSNLVALCEECHEKVHGVGRTNLSTLTKIGLQKAKEKGVKLGGVRPGTLKSNEAAKAKADSEAEQLRPILEAMVAKGATLREMAAALAGAGRTTRNGQPLSATQVKRLIGRLALTSTFGN